MYIYKITNNFNDLAYVGLTQRPLNESMWYYGSGIYINRAIKKHGRDKFKKEILEMCDSVEELSEAEKKWILKCDSIYPNGYNIASGGLHGYVYTKETYEKISKKLKKLTGEKSWHFGKKRSKETKEKIRQANLGKVLSEETREKIRQVNLGKIIPQETIDKVIKTKRKHDSFNYTWKGEPAWNRRKVLQYDKEMNFIKEYDSITEAGIAMNIAPGAIVRICKGRGKTCRKFIWRYKDE